MSERGSSDRIASPKGASPGWPGWVCKNCGRRFPEDTPHVKCPGKPSVGDRPGEPCMAPLVRWLRYEEKRG